MQYRGDVVINRPRGHDKIVRDLCARVARRQQKQDLALPDGEPGRIGPGAVLRAARSPRHAECTQPPSQELDSRRRAEVGKDVQSFKGGVDLSVLVSTMASAVGSAVAERLEAEGYARIRPSYGYLIQHLVTENVTAAELARRVGVSKQAATKSVHELYDQGLVEYPGPDRRVALSAAGHALVTASRRIRAELEAEFEAAAGARAVKSCRKTLVTLIEALGADTAVRGRRLLPPS